MRNPAQQAKPVQNVLLDTCILQYLDNTDFGNQVLAYLQELIGRGFTLAISEISIYELLSGSTVENETKGLSTLKLFKTFQVTETVLLAGSRISTLYQREKNPIGRKLIQDDSISLQDKIIASTALLTGSLVLTGDINDFPRPFFDEIEQKRIIYPKKGKPVLLVMEILSPNHAIISARFDNRR